MSKNAIKPQNLPETLVWYYIICTYLFYLLGAQYIFTPVLASILVFFVLKKWLYQTAKTPLNQKIDLSPLTWIWIIAMSIMEIALIIGHINFDFSIIQALKSSLYWYRHWALFALFPVAACLNIRSQIIYRASCIFCCQCLILVIISNLANLANLPIFSYVSPLQVLGGDEMYYKVSLFFSEPSYGEGFRLKLFTPWAPALGLMGNIYFFLTYQETNPRWRWLGILGAIAMIISSVSRAAIICLPTVMLLFWLIINFFKAKVQLAASFSCFLIGIFSSTLIEWINEIKESFRQFRPGSSKVRSAIGRITLDRWWNEAPIWGHGINMSRGPASIGYMPVGTHHTWYGVLYLHGLVGFFVFAIPFLLSIINLINKIKASQINRVAFCLILVLLLFSFGENIENLAYLYWQGLLIIGIAFKENNKQIASNQKPLLFESN